MGHIHLGRLPRTQSWNAVVDLLHAGASTPEIATATAKAAENSLATAASDPALRHAFWLLTQLPLAARSTDFINRLFELGITAGKNPSLLTLAAGFQQSVDARIRNAKLKTDLGQMAKLSATEALTNVLAAELPGLFVDTTGEDVRYALGKLAAPDRFARLSRNFFARLINRNLEYFISRAIADHVGPDRGLRSIADYADFRQALAQHCFEAALIVEAFSSEWYSKANWRGGITEAKAAGFSYVAFKKLREELRQRAADV
jgi:hypothetical protein